MGFEKLWIVFVVCLLACSVGFHNFIWFMSVGYGLAVAAGGAAILILFFSKLTWVTVIQCAVLLFYGIRLAYFLWSRERTSKSYKDAMKGVTDSTVPMPVMIVMWLFMGVLYTMQVSPVFYRLFNGSTDTVLPLIGAVISFAGTVIEAMADAQKSEQKKKNPKKVATEGLFRICRCPNYFGEITFWTGVFISGWGVLKGGQWIVAILGYLMILGIMISGAQRLEKRQNKNYGHMPEYRAYVEKTPILVPFIPVYHLVKEK
jgi:steroid 5-alpha reductase family enzyme